MTGRFTVGLLALCLSACAAAPQAANGERMTPPASTITVRESIPAPSTGGVVEAPRSFVMPVNTMQ